MRIRTPDQSSELKARSGSKSSTRPWPAARYSTSTATPSARRQGDHDHRGVGPRRPVWRLRFHRARAGRAVVHARGAWRGHRTAENHCLPRTERGLEPCFPGRRRFDLGGRTRRGGLGTACPGEGRAHLYGFGHNWGNILPATPANRTQYPLAFAEVDGRRGSSPQLCSEDPDVVRLSVEAARRAFSRTPETPVFSLSPNDGYGFCKDDRCRRIDALYGVTDGSLSDRFVHYANA